MEAFTAWRLKVWLMLKRWFNNLLTPLWLVVVICAVMFYLTPRPLNAAHLRQAGALTLSGFDGWHSYEVLTAMFLHMSPTHLVNNMLWLIVMGVLANSIPTRRLNSLWVFLAAGLTGNTAFILVMWVLHGTMTLVGASGGLLGVMGNLLVLLAAMVIHGRKGAVSAKYGVYGHYGLKFLAVLGVTGMTFYYTYMFMGTETMLVHVVGFITGLITGWLTYLNTFSTIKTHKGYMQVDQLKGRVQPVKKRQTD